MKGTAYTSTTLQGAGGTTPYTWSLASGSLPAGLTLSSNGTISGTPSSRASTQTFTVKLTDSYKRTATKSYTITVA